MNQKEKVYVNAYEVTREFGGHEEGGWWYDNYSCLESVPTKRKYADEISEDLNNEYKRLKWGDISSVLGGVDIIVLIEDVPAKSHTYHKPVYE